MAKRQAAGSRQVSLPKAALRVLQDNGFQVMPFKATRRWPTNPQFWIEVSVSGAQGSPVTFMKACEPVRDGHARHSINYIGYAIEVAGNATAEMIADAYQHFLNLNDGLAGGFHGIRQFPEVPNRGGPAIPPAVSTKQARQ